MRRDAAGRHQGPAPRAPRARPRQGGQACGVLISCRAVALGLCLAAAIFARVQRVGPALALRAQRARGRRGAARARRRPHPARRGHAGALPRHRQVQRRRRRQPATVDPAEAQRHLRSRPHALLSRRAVRPALRRRGAHRRRQPARAGARREARARGRLRAPDRARHRLRSHGARRAARARPLPGRQPRVPASRSTRKPSRSTTRRSASSPASTPEAGGDGIGRDAAWNRAIALRRQEDQKDAGSDAPDSSDGSDAATPPTATTCDGNDGVERRRRRRQGRRRQRRGRRRRQGRRGQRRRRRRTDGGGAAPESARPAAGRPSATPQQDNAHAGAARAERRATRGRRRSSARGAHAGGRRWRTSDRARRGARPAFARRRRWPASRFEAGARGPAAAADHGAGERRPRWRWASPSPSSSGPWSSRASPSRARRARPAARPQRRRAERDLADDRRSDSAAGASVQVGLRAMWQLVGQRPGRFTIPAPTVQWNGRRLAGHPVDHRGGARHRPGRGGSSTSNPFLMPGGPGFSFSFRAPRRLTPDDDATSEPHGAPELALPSAPDPSFFVRAVPRQEERGGGPAGLVLDLRLRAHPAAADPSPTTTRRSPTSCASRSPRTRAPIRRSTPWWAARGTSPSSSIRWRSSRSTPATSTPGKCASRFIGASLRHAGAIARRRTEIVHVTEPPRAGRPRGIRARRRRAVHAHGGGGAAAHRPGRRGRGDACASRDGEPAAVAARARAHGRRVARAREEGVDRAAGRRRRRVADVRLRGPRQGERHRRSRRGHAALLGSGRRAIPGGPGGARQGRGQADGAGGRSRHPAAARCSRRQIRSPRCPARAPRSAPMRCPAVACSTGARCGS